MHSRIFQVSRTPFVDGVNANDEELLTVENVPEWIENEVDYVLNSEDEQEDLEWLDSHINTSCIEINKQERTITIVDGLNGLKTYAQGVLDAIKTEVENATVADLCCGHLHYKINEIIGDPYFDMMIYDVDEAECKPVLRWLIDITLTTKPGDKLYIGGILDYHN